MINIFFYTFAALMPFIFTHLASFGFLVLHDKLTFHNKVGRGVRQKGLLHDEGWRGVRQKVILFDKGEGG